MHAHSHSHSHAHDETNLDPHATADYDDDLLDLDYESPNGHEAWDDGHHDRSLPKQNQGQKNRIVGKHEDRCLQITSVRVPKKAEFELRLTKVFSFCRNALK